MKDILIPTKFFYSHYDGSKYPGSGTCNGIENGANCQYFAYELLRHFGLNLPDLRSSNLWEDRTSTKVVTEFEPLDLLLFNNVADPYGAHVGVYVGKRKVLHLCKEVGHPAIWDLSEFEKREPYAYFIGGKRVLKDRSAIK